MSFSAGSSSTGGNNIDVRLKVIGDRGFIASMKGATHAVDDFGDEVKEADRKSKDLGDTQTTLKGTLGEMKKVLVDNNRSYLGISKSMQNVNTQATFFRNTMKVFILP